MNPDDGWCDAADDIRYNMHVVMPYPRSAEHLWREDHVYDIVIVLGYNDDPAVPGKGSAIFMHVAREHYSPTAGCIALSLDDLTDILGSITTETKVCVGE